MTIRLWASSSRGKSSARSIWSKRTLRDVRATSTSGIQIAFVAGLVGFNPVVDVPPGRNNRAWLTPSQKHRIVILTALRHAGRDAPIGGGSHGSRKGAGVWGDALFRRGR